MPRPHGTYSIVAFDPATGEHGVAVQSHWFSVGSLCPWARPGVGAVATQSIVEPAHGPNTLDRLADGLDATSALAAVLAGDDVSAMRQVGVVDSRGRVAAHTGDGCIAEAGHVLGEHWACQANMMARATVPQAMSAGFAAASGDLAGRLLAALQAAEAEGRRRPGPAVGGARRRPGVGRALADAGQPARRGPRRSDRRAGPAARPAACLRAGRLRRRPRRRRTFRRSGGVVPRGRDVGTGVRRVAVLGGSRTRPRRRSRWRRRRHRAGGGEASRLADAARSPLARDRPGGGSVFVLYLSRIDSRNLLTTLMTDRPAPRVDGT